MDFMRFDRTCDQTYKVRNFRSWR